MYDTTSFLRIFDSRLSYAKGAYLLHMQRWILGDELFFSAMQNYFNDEKVANGFAYSDDWIRHIEAAGDTSLTEFFNDWLYNEGYPIYSASYRQHTTDSLTFNLSQITSHNSVDFFKLPVPVRVYNSSKTDSADFRLNHTTNNQTFILNPGFIVDQFVIDPDNWILCLTDNITSTPIVSTKNKMEVYPNPTSDNISIVIPNNQTIEKIFIYSISGNLLRQFTGNQNNINLSSLPAANYLLQVETINSVYSQRIITQ